VEKASRTASKWQLEAARSVRNVFREVVQQADLNQTYATSEEMYSAHMPRPLHRLTTHSLRHYAITRFAKSTNGNVVLASRFVRHASPSTTMRYIAKDKDELYKNMDSHLPVR
jgi:integrase